MRMTVVPVELNGVVPHQAGTNQSDRLVVEQFQWVIRFHDLRRRLSTLCTGTVPSQVCQAYLGPVAILPFDLQDAVNSFD